MGKYEMLARDVATDVDFAPFLVSTFGSCQRTSWFDEHLPVETVFMLTPTDKAVDNFTHEFLPAAQLERSSGTSIS